MNGRRLSLALSLSLAVSPAFAADHAQPRSGGGGGGGAHASGHSGGGYSNGGSSGGGQSGYHAVRRGSGGSSARGAEARHPRAGTGYYYRGRSYYRSYPRYYGYGYGGYYAYDPYLYYYGYSPYYDYAPYYGGGYYYSRPYEPAYGYSNAQGAVRLLVEPDKTKVYVDGYYSGTVDDYDGLFQRLYLPMGKHEIVLRLEGYESQRLKVYVSPGETLKIRHEMEKGSGDSTREIVAGDPSIEKYPPRLRSDDADDDRSADEADDDSAEDAPPAHMATRQPDRAGADATLRLTVVPDDASIYVDGRFYGTARDARRVEVAPGKHKIEAVRPGYRTFEKDVEVAADDTANLDVTLER
jgi:PEGA domain